MKLSAFAAQILADAKEIDMESLDLHRAFQPSILLAILSLNGIGSKEYDSQGPGGPQYETWGANAVFWTVTQSYAGISDFFLRYAKAL